MAFLSELQFPPCIWISTQEIRFCTKESVFCDYTQLTSDKNHPHAGLDRGVFKEEENGFVRFIDLPWDIPGVDFEALPEFVALQEHFSGEREWKNSEFANRNAKYIELGNSVRGYSSSSEFLVARQNEIIDLYKSIKLYGIQEIEDPQRYIDNLSVNITNEGNPLFNNRGHHRLAMAKILDIPAVPVKVTVARNIAALSVFQEKWT